MKFALLDYPQDARNVRIALGGDADCHAPPPQAAGNV